MRRGRVAVAALFASALLAGTGISVVLQSDDSAPSVTKRNDGAGAVYRAGLDHELALRYGAAIRAYRAALEIDPGFLPPFFEMVGLLAGASPEFMLEFIDSLALRQRDDGLRDCMQDIGLTLRGRFKPLVTSGSLSPDAWACREFFRYLTYVGPGQTVLLATLRRLERYRDVPTISRLIFDATQRVVGTSEALAVTRRFQRREFHPLVRASAYGLEANWQHKVGDHAAALATEARTRADPSWSLGGFRVRHYPNLLHHEELVASGIRSQPDAVVHHARDVVEEAIGAWRRASHEGDQVARLIEGIQAANWLLDRGRLNEALSEWTALRAVADSVADPAIRALVYMRFGRTLVKTGRLAEAERQLLASRALQDSGGSANTHKETEHNLLHLYEALGNDIKARRAGERFVRFAQMPGLHGVRMMSARDFGRFLRARGDIEESRRFFARMLADIDSLGENWIWAGEYHELSGELDLARRYYVRGLETGGAEVVRMLEGLVRISLMAGDSTAAITFARAHDQRRTVYGVPESAPLLPGVLRNLGRIAEARTQLEQARKLVDASGQIAARASLTLELAELEMSQRDFTRARFLADSAVTVARTVAAVDLALRARAVAALAAVRSGDRSLRFRQELDQVAREADALGHAQLRVEMRRRRAQGEALSKNWREALLHYGAAAAISDSMAQTIALDPQQASFRAAQRAVYDGALATILARANEPEAPSFFADWSRRRKSRGYAPKTEANVRRGLPNVAPGRALIDYVVLDSAVAALVVTHSRAVLVMLPVSADSVRTVVRQLHTAMAARVGSAIDLTRARFPLPLARQLYGQLVAPLEGFLGEARELAIVPDGPLFLVPFDALVTQLPPPGSANPYTDAQYLVDRYVVVQSVSAEGAVPGRRLQDGRMVTVAPVTVGALGDESGREVAAIARVLPATAAAVLRGPEATERAVRELAGGSAILHFAAHATVNHHDPASSRLTLAASAGDDGALHSDEIAQLRLPGTLVVLSACETAAGRVLDGEGVLSISRSFLRAGASATVATLWPVGPQSADFMAAFYLALARGDSPAVALREAKLTMRRAGVPPFVWAPYAVIARGAS